jgi:hypothetical protein
VYAVLEDMRTTLRMAWVDPALRALTSQPLFFTAAWAATRPNLTKSFSSGAERIRMVALETVRAEPEWSPPGVFQEADGADLERLRRTLQAIHCSAPRVLLVIQAWAFLARRRRLPGTGLEEPPARRGVPGWQDGLVALSRPIPAESEALLDDATVALRSAFTPPALHALALYPHRLESVWRRLGRAPTGPRWNQAVLSIRRVASDVLRSLPHPMDLQWDVLSRRGLSEDRRQALADHLMAVAGSMPASVLVASAAAESYGVADVPGDW